VLFSTDEWSSHASPGELHRIGGASPCAFADALEAFKPKQHCDLLFSLERVWRCDVYRAGDGVHAAWLNRRAEFEPPWKPWLRRFSRKHRELLELERQLFTPEAAGVVIANSHMVRREIEEHFGYPSDRIYVVHNGVPAPSAEAAFTREAARRELGFARDAYVLLFAGSGWERKGLRYAIAALERAAIPQSTLLVAGRGRRGGLPRSSRVRFLGAVPDLPRYHAAADVFLLPTLYEPFSNACLEAAAAGLPVITTRCNGFAEVIEAGTEGEVIEDPSHLDALAAALVRWSAPEHRASAEPRLRELGGRLSIEANVQATLAILARAGAAEP
jgi:UDP-glucose:(heptosyl)LPS alpha-1,3-glucosyltransferase